MDNFLTNVPLSGKLLNNNLTIVETLRQYKLDIPPIMKPSKLQELHSPEFGFHGNMTMVSYMQKKGRAVVVLSTMHDDKAVDASSHFHKPEVIMYYNKTKGGVDTVDQMINNYTCQRTRRYNMLDVAILNAYTNSLHNTLIIWMVRTVHISYLSRSWERAHHASYEEAHGWHTNSRSILLRQWEGVGKKNTATTKLQEDIRPEGQRKRQRCAICPVWKDKKPADGVQQCTRPVCQEHKHLVIICEECKNWDGDLCSSDVFSCVLFWLVTFHHLTVDKQMKFRSIATLSVIRGMCMYRKWRNCCKNSFIPIHCLR